MSYLHFIWLKYVKILHGHYETFSVLSAAVHELKWIRD